MICDTDAIAISERIDSRDRYHTLCARRREPNGLSIHDELDSFVASLSTPAELTFNGLGNRWLEIDESEARFTLTYILAHDIAFGTPEISEPDAAALVDAFLALFDSPTRFFSNGSFNRDTHGWSGYGFVTNATCETGVIVIGATRIGLLWCHDED